MKTFEKTINWLMPTIVFGGIAIWIMNYVGVFEVLLNLKPLFFEILKSLATVIGFVIIGLAVIHFILKELFTLIRKS